MQQAEVVAHLVRDGVRRSVTIGDVRPFFAGRPAQVLGFAMVLGIASMAILLVLVNAITACLTFASLIGYAFIYTGFLKRATPQNIVIGGLAGAAPPALGWVHKGRQTPWVAIIFTTSIAFGLIYFVSTSDSPVVTALGGTTALLLLGVFTIVNIACMILRRDPTPDGAFRAPTVEELFSSVELS